MRSNVETRQGGGNLPLMRLLDLQDGAIAAVVGCGGKTALIRLLAAENAAKRVLVSTTTRIRPPAVEAVCVDLESCKNRVPRAGIVYMGLLDGKTGKLGALPAGCLAERAKEYDLTLLEADGSKMLPLKGWREGEPVVPPFCTHTVGVLPVWPLGLPAREDIVQRLPEFLRLTGLSEGDPVTVEALGRMVCAPGGMFKNAVGKRFLLINQVEDERAERGATELLAHIAERRPGYFKGMIYGSVHREEWNTI